MNLSELLDLEAQDLCSPVQQLKTYDLCSHPNPHEATKTPGAYWGNHPDSSSVWPFNRCRDSLIPSQISDGLGGSPAVRIFVSLKTQKGYVNVLLPSQVCNRSGVLLQTASRS